MMKTDKRYKDYKSYKERKRILFLSPVQPLLTPGDPLPRWQMQASWVRALGRGGHEVRVVKYTPDDRIRLGWGERVWWNFKVLRNSDIIGDPRRHFFGTLGQEPSLTSSSPLGQSSNKVFSGSSSMTSKMTSSARLPSFENASFDLIIYSLGADVLLPLALHYIKVKIGAPLVVLSGVSPIKQGNPRERAMAALVDLAATNDESHAREWLELGAKRAAALPIAGVDPELVASLDGVSSIRSARNPRSLRRCFPVDIKDNVLFSSSSMISETPSSTRLKPKRFLERDIDVVFIGTLTEKRKKFFSKLRRLLPDKIKMAVKEFVWEEEYAELMSRAKIGINLLRPEMEQGVNLRAFEIPAFGAMEISSFCREEWLTPGKEVEVFNSAEEAAELVKKYLADDKARVEIAERGRRRVMREHTFDERARKLMEIVKRKR